MSINHLDFLASIYIWAANTSFLDFALIGKKCILTSDPVKLSYLRIQHIEEFFFCLLVSYYPKTNTTVR